MRRIDQNEPGSSSGGGLYPRPLLATAATPEPSGAAASPSRTFPDIVIRRMTHERGVYKVVIRTRDEAVGRAALESARDLVMAAINDTPYDIGATIAKLTDMVDRRCLGPSTACIVDAATERGIPHIRLNDGNLVQLGQGAAQRRIWTAETDRTSAIAEGISRDKDLTKQLLAAAGVPVP